LTATLSLFLGIEAAVVLRDVCLVSDEEAREIKVWGANVILQAALLESSQRANVTKSKKDAKARPRAKRAA
jgi:hypothetical protein